MLVYAPGWSLASQFWSYTPPKLVFPRPKNENSPLKTVFLIHFFLKILAFYCLCGENFVTPFSTLAMIQGSLPTNSTTPDRLRSWAKTESEDFPGFWVQTLSKKKFFKRPTIESWSTPQKKPITGFSWPGGQYSRDKCWPKKILFLGRRACRTYKLAGGRPKKSFLFGHLFLIDIPKRLLRQKPGGACLYMPQDGHWLASFEVIRPPPKLVCSRKKILKGCAMRTPRARGRC